MRLVEFADAEEQLALWKLVSDHMWKAIAQQAEQQAAEREEKARQAPLPKPKPLYPNKTEKQPTVQPMPKSAMNAPNAANSRLISQSSTSKDLTQGNERQA
jgi:hypothetical protein